MNTVKKNDDEVMEEVLRQNHNAYLGVPRDTH